MLVNVEFECGARRGKRGCDGFPAVYAGNFCGREGLAF